MHVEIKSEAHKYHVSFEQDGSKKFKKGPNKGRPQTVTECNIFLLTDAEPTLVNTGVTVLGPKDDDDSYIGCKEAFTRALETTYFNKRETTVFWKEFHKQHKVRKPSCVEKFSNVLGPSLSGSVHGYGGSHSFHMKRAESRSCRVGQNVTTINHADYGKKLARLVADNELTARMSLASAEQARKVDELKKRPSWLRRAWSWVSRIEPDADSLRKPPASSGLWQMIYDNHCDSCHIIPAGGFLQGPRGGVRCSACGQKYWIDPFRRRPRRFRSHRRRKSIALAEDWDVSAVTDRATSSI